MDAAEVVAVHTERFGVDAGDPSTDPILGARPPTGEARLSYERSVRLLRAAESSPVEPVTEIPVPSLFD